MAVIKFLLGPSIDKYNDSQAQLNRSDNPPEYVYIEASVNHLLLR